MPIGIAQKVGFGCHCAAPDGAVAVTRQMPFPPKSEPTFMPWECPESDRIKPGWSAVTSNGRSRHRSGSAFTRSCTTATDSACSQTPQSAPTASSAVCWNCWSSRTLCFLSLWAALWSFAGGARAQASPGSAYNRLAVTQAICRQYAAMQRALPYDMMYAQCMYARGYRVPGFSPSPDSPGYQGELPGPPAHNGGA